MDGSVPDEERHARDQLTCRLLVAGQLLKEYWKQDRGRCIDQAGYIEETGSVVNLCVCVCVCMCVRAHARIACMCVWMVHVLICCCYFLCVCVQDRKNLLKRFKAEETRVLVCTDIASRGIDCSHVRT